MSYKFNVDKFAATIEVFIQMHNLTNSEFAELAGIGTSTLYPLKNGEIAPNMAQFVSICNVMGVEPQSYFKKVK